MGLECKRRMLRNIWSNRQIWPWSKERIRAKANRVLPRERTGQSKHPLPKTQEKTLHMESPDGWHQNQIDYILCSQRWRSSIQSTKTRPVADCGSDHELFIAKFRLTLKKVRKTTRPFRYDLNESLMIIQWSDKKIQGIRSDRVPEALWTEVRDIVQKVVTRTIPKKCKGKMVV